MPSIVAKVMFTRSIISFTVSIDVSCLSKQLNNGKVCCLWNLVQVLSKVFSSDLSKQINCGNACCLSNLVCKWSKQVLYGLCMERTQFLWEQVSFHHFPCAEVVALVHINALAILTTFVGHLNLLNLLTIFADVLNLICFTQGNLTPHCNLHWEYFV